MLPSLLPPARRRLVTAVLALAVALTLLATTASASPSDRRDRSDHPAGSPGTDFPRLPKRCYDPYNPAPTGNCPIVRAGADRPTVVLWGDSHAWQYLPAVESEAKERDLNLVLFEAGGCPVSLRKRPSPRFASCDNSNQAAFDYVTGLKADHQRVRVLLGSFWAYYRIGYRKLQHGEPDDAYHNHLFRTQHHGTRPLFRALAKAGVPFDLIGQSPSVPDDAADCGDGNDPYQCDLTRKEAMPRESDTRRWLRRLTDGLPGRHRYIDTTGTYCSKSTCRPTVGDANTYFDSFHLGARMAATLGDYFEPPMDQLLDAPR